MSSKMWKPRWYGLSENRLGARLHHRDVIRVALRRFKEDLNSPLAPDIMEQLRSEMNEQPVRSTDK
jgi:hypothetical protein